jgi:RimJ/RimL family protein N-acetyltransferase
VHVVAATERPLLRRFTADDVDRWSSWTATELGYRLRPSAWGRGPATEASRTMVDRTFATGGAERIVAQTMAVNTG